MSPDLETLRAAVDRGRQLGLIRDPLPKPKPLAPPRPNYRPMLDRIARRVASATGFTVEELRAKPANATLVDPVAFARQLLCASAKTAGIPDPDIAKFLKRTRAMVHYAVHRVSGKWRTDSAFRADWQDLTGRTDDPATLYTPRTRKP